MAEQLSDDVLRQHYCLEQVDVVPGDPETTAFKRRARLQQALWRESRGLPVGTQPMRAGEGRACRPLGSRIELAFARQSGANFLGEPVRAAVAARLGQPERHQTLNEDRLFGDLLSSMPLCFNLFGWLDGDLDAATRAVRAWWPDAPGRVSAVRFEWSPGRRDPDYLGNRSAFDVAFELALEDGSRGILGIETKYHEDCRKEKAPEGPGRRRYEAVTARSGVFVPEALDAIPGTDLQQIWLDHLLALSMLQHPVSAWRWARFVLVHPQANPSYARASRRYGAALADSATFEVRTLESLLEACVLPPAGVAAFRERYLW